MTPSTLTFTEWLRDQAEREDAIGELARAATEDDWPETSDRDELRMHLQAQNAAGASLAALEQAHVEFSARPVGASEERESRLVSIAEAAELTGISKKALRSRVDRGSMPFVLEGGVRLIDVAELARLGLLTGSGAAAAGDADDAAAGPRQEGDAMLVRLSDWQRLMDQVGNVFELSRELADSSARAAKAETQAEFFRGRFQEERDRVRELEQQLAEQREPPAAASESVPRKSWLARLFAE
jgi:hypothetical protein